MRIVAALVAASLLAGCSVFGIRSGYEQSAYTVVDTIDGGVEIRAYPAQLAAETPMAGGDEDDRDAAFRRLFDYISGGNQIQAEVAMTAPVEVGASEQVAMTVPVETAPSEDGEVMRFFLPASYNAATAPAPTDAMVEIVELPPTKVAVLRFSGLWDEERFEAREAELIALLQGSAWRPVGSPSTLFYDPPWTLPWLRRNEAVVAVTGAPATGS